MADGAVSVRSEDQVCCTRRRVIVGGVPYSLDRPIGDSQGQGGSGLL